MLWAEGTSRLLDFSPDGGFPLLIVPSLINRGLVLDLLPGQSFLDHLRSAGFRPLLVDWQVPGETERKFDLTAYIAGRLDRIVDIVIDRIGPRLGLVGYCMGGLLSLALGLRRRATSPLVLIATPWDFAASTVGYGAALAAFAPLLRPLFGTLEEVPAAVLQTLFMAADPLLALRKFQHFAELDPTSEEARRFVATEAWLNDGVPLSIGVAEECFAGWYGRNTPAEGEWRVAGRAVSPAEFDRPALVVIPQRDRLVPPASAAALAEALPRRDVLEPPLGHIGFAASPRAREAVWQPIAAWLQAAVT